MKITQIRENGDTEALSVTDIDLLIEKMKKEMWGRFNEFGHNKHD